MFGVKYGRVAFIHKVLGTLRSDDGDGNEDVKKAIGLITKTTILYVHHTFLYISLQSLHDRDVVRGTQRQSSENICSEDDLRTRIFGTFFVKFSCLPTSPRLFEHLKNGVIAHF